MAASLDLPLPAVSAPLSSLTPETAWQPLPDSEWDDAAARHLLRRIGFSASGAAIADALAAPPATLLSRAFAAMPSLPEPERIAAFRREETSRTSRLRDVPAQNRRAISQERRERAREALIDLTLRWLQLAREPVNSAAEKWLLFLSDVWVVSEEKVKDAALLFDHQDILRRHALGPAPSLAKAVLRSPAMIQYLDLQQSRAGAPNENFARELFELFTLGQGHYTENDIKQAARAFTGYRQRNGHFRFAAGRHDRAPQTIFGETARFDGDAVIDLVFRQPAAGTFLPGELARFYLSDQPLPEGWLEPLGSWWSGTGYDLRALAIRFFSSRLFFAGDFRGNFIKSPVQFHLGLLQDLSLDVTPLRRRVIGPLKQMGQLPFDPPNVRGWVGGRSWINSATLAARRQLVRSLVSPIDPEALNADEIAALRAATAAGARDFTLPESTLRAWGGLSAPETAHRLLAVAGLDGDRDGPLAAALTSFLSDTSRPSPGMLRDALSGLLESPAYQLC